MVPPTLLRATALMAISTPHSKKFRLGVAVLGGLLLASILARVVQRLLIGKSAEVVRELARQPKEGGPLPVPAASADPLPLPPPIADADFEPVHDPAHELLEQEPSQAKSKPLPTIRVSPEVVDGWVRRGVIPEVVFAPPLSGLPSGLVCPLAPAFVPGLRKDDRLVRVDGARVASLEDIVLRIAAARRAGRGKLTGTFCREESGRIKCLNLLVEMPALTDP